MLTQSRNFWRRCVQSLFTRASAGAVRKVKRQRRPSRAAAVEVLEGRALLSLTGFNSTVAGVYTALDPAGLVTPTTSDTRTATTSGSVRATVTAIADIYKTSGGGTAGRVAVTITAGGASGDSLGIASTVTSTHSSTAGSGGGATSLAGYNTTVTASFNTGSTTAGTISYGNIVLANFALTNAGTASTTATITFAGTGATTPWIATGAGSAIQQWITNQNAATPSPNLANNTTNQEHAWNHLYNAVLKIVNFSTTQGAASSRTLTYTMTDTNGNVANGVRTQALTINGNAAPTGLNITPVTTVGGLPGIAENTVQGTSVGTLTSVDTSSSTQGESWTYSLVADTVTPANSADNNLFQISGNQLQRSAQAMNFEAKSVYKIRLRTVDSAGGTFTGNYTINGINVNEAPTAVSLDNANVNENLAAPAVVGTITGTDPDAGTSLTFSVLGTDAAHFEAVQTSGVWQLRTKSAFNYETQGPFSIVIRASDGSLTFDQPFAIGVNNVNEAPTDITLIPSSLNENNVSNDVIGTLSTDDPDLLKNPQTFTYSIETGSDSGFNVWLDPNDGQQKLRTTNLFNYESKSSYTVILKSTDNGLNGSPLSTTKTFTINVVDLDEAPTWTTAANPSVNENSQFVATLSASDPEGTAIAYSIRTDATTDFGKFELRTNGTTGATELWFKNGSAPDYESPQDGGGNNVYDVHIDAFDKNQGTGTLSTKREFSVAVLPVNDNAPVFTTTSPQYADEMQTGVTTLAATDADGVANAFTGTFSLVGGADQSLFNLTSAGVLTFKTAQDYDIVGGQKVFYVTVRANDGVNTTDLALTINLVDINEGGIIIYDPVESNGQNAPISVAENVKVVYTVKAKDFDLSTNPYIRFQLQNGQDSSLFSIDSVTGVLSWVADAGIDYEDSNRKNDYSIQVRAYDTTDTNTNHDDLVNIRVTVTNVADNAPVITNATTSLNYSENNTTDVTNITLTDLDFGVGGVPTAGSYTLSVVGGADGALFEIGTNDNLLFKSSPDFETPLGTINPSNPNVYEVTVQATDSTGTQSSSTKTFTITVQNVNEAPTDIKIGGDSTGNVDENLPAGTLVGVLSPVDPDAGDSHTFQLIDTAGYPDNAQFEIVDGNKLQTKATFDHETKPSYQIKIRVRDLAGTGLTYDHILGITVNDLPEGPTPLSPVAVSFAERATGLVATVDTTTLGFVGPYTFEIVSGADRDLGVFTVNTSGQLNLTSALNFEQRTDANLDGVYVVDIKVTSDANPIGVLIPYQVTITEANDPFIIGTDKTSPTYVAPSWTEDAGAAAFDPNILLADEDAVPTPVNSGRIWAQITNWESGDHFDMSTDTTADVYRVRVVDSSGTRDEVYIRDSGNLIKLGTTTGGSNFLTHVLDINLTTDATIPLVQTALRNVRFNNLTGGPAYDRQVTIALKVYDQFGVRNDPYYAPLAIKAQPDAPVITSTLTQPGLYTENGAASGVDGTLWLSDPDRPADWAGVVVTATLVNPQAGDLLSIGGAEDGLLAGTDGTISDGKGNQIGSYEILDNGNQAKMTMTGGVSARLLRLIRYRSTSENPSTVRREISISVNDGALTTTRSSFVDVKRTNDAPSFVLSSGSQTYPEDSAAVNVVAEGQTVTVTDPDENIHFNGGRLVVTLVNSTNSLATLGLRNQGASPAAGQIGVSGTTLLWGSDTIGTVSGVGSNILTLAFTSDLVTPELVATLASNVTLFTARQFAATDPWLVRFAFSDGALSSPVADTWVTFTPSNDAVQLATGSTSSVNFTEGGAAIRLGPSMTVADPDVSTTGSWGGRFVTVSLANATAFDSLGILNQGTAAGQINTTGNDIFAGSILIGTIVSNGAVDSNLVLRIELKAGATQAFLTSLLRSVTLFNSNVNPSVTGRNVTWTVDDDPTFVSASATTRVAIIAVNSAPSVITSTEAQLPWAQFTENTTTPVIVDSGFSISDNDLNSTNSSFNGGYVRVRIYQGTSSDRLQIVAGNGITVSGTAVLFNGTQIGTFSGGTGTAAMTITLNSLSNTTLVGADAVIALGRSIGYSNVGDDPTSLQRWISFELNDSKVWSPIANRSVGVTPINDPPVIKLGAPSISFAEDTAFILADSTGTVTDLDNTSFPGGSLTAALTSNGSADDRLGIATTAAITLDGTAVRYNGTAFADYTGGVGTDPLVITFRSGSVATVAAAQALYRAIYFTNVNTANPSTATRTLTFTLLDGPAADLSTGSSVQAKSIVVVGVNDLSTFSGLTDVLFVVGTSAGVLIAENGSIADVDSMDFNAGSLTAAISLNLQSGDSISLRTLSTDSATSGLFINNSTKEVFFNGIKFATFSGGTGTTAFTLSFNLNSNAVNVSAVLKRLVFKTNSTSTLQRKITLTMRDGDGGTTTTDVFVNVSLV